MIKLFLDLVRCPDIFVKILPCNMFEGKMYGLLSCRVLIVKLGTNLETCSFVAKFFTVSIL